jgi:hypothetical protein
MTKPLVAVITTIQRPTASVAGLTQRLRELKAPLIVIGDRKGPADFDAPQAELVTLDQQLRLPLELARLLPTGHYVRKNIGYLMAIARGASCIYETDDDNMPAPNWSPRTMRTAAIRISPRPWVNVFRLFSDQVIWPRGFPLQLITSEATYRHDPAAPVENFESPIQQGLADLSPDVDAIWRLVLDREFRFRQGPSVWLPPGTWCPFNSQSTWWWPAAYPLMYLPSRCTFRMTDIWRSFVAQRCLWELGCGMVFHAAEVVQERNPHRLIKDFEDEVPGYLQNERIVGLLANARLQPGPSAVGENLLRCYEALVAGGIFPADEMPLVRAWLADTQRKL